MPVVGLIPMAYQGISPVADHLAYVPLVGLVGLAAAGLRANSWRGGGKSRRRSAWRRRRCSAALWPSKAIVMRISFGIPKPFGRKAVRRNPGSWVTHDNLGTVYRRGGRLPEAVAEFEQSLRLNPNYIEAHANLALAETQRGNMPEATISHYETALRLRRRFRRCAL